MPILGATESPQTLDRPRTMRDVLVFFGLTFLLTTPFWAISTVSGKQLMPGLPLAAIAVVCPAMAALFLAWQLGGAPGGRALLMRTFDCGRIRVGFWWIPILLVLPAVSVASFLILRYDGSGVPNPHISILPSLALFAVFLVSALSEEMGWSAFAIDPLQARLGALPAALLLGAVWAVWHFPALLEAHRSVRWIAWWTLGTVALRLFMVWIFNRTGGSVFGVAVVHAVSNLCWQLFPIRGSWFDPRLNGLIMGGLALAVVLASIRQSGVDRAHARARTATTCLPNTVA